MKSIQTILPMLVLVASIAFMLLPTALAAEDEITEIIDEVEDIDDILDDILDEVDELDSEISDEVEAAATELRNIRYSCGAKKPVNVTFSANSKSVTIFLSRWY